MGQDGRQVDGRMGQGGWQSGGVWQLALKHSFHPSAVLDAYLPSDMMNFKIQNVINFIL